MSESIDLLREEIAALREKLERRNEWYDWCREEVGPLYPGGTPLDHAAKSEIIKLREKLATAEARIARVTIDLPGGRSFDVSVLAETGEEELRVAWTEAGRMHDAALRERDGLRGKLDAVRAHDCCAETPCCGGTGFIEGVDDDGCEIRGRCEGCRCCALLNDPPVPPAHAPSSPPRDREADTATARAALDSYLAGKTDSHGYPVAPTCATCGGPWDDQAMNCPDCGNETASAPKCVTCGDSGSVHFMRYETVLDENGEPGGEAVADAAPCPDCRKETL